MLVAGVVEACVFVSGPTVTTSVYQLNSFWVGGASFDFSSDCRCFGRVKIALTPGFYINSVDCSGFTTAHHADTQGHFALQLNRTYYYVAQLINQNGTVFLQSPESSFLTGSAPTPTETPTVTPTDTPTPTPTP